MPEGPINLHPDLLRCLVEDDDDGFILHNRLIIDGEPEPSRYAALNQAYRQKLSNARAAFSERDWENYIFLHQKPYRLHALRRCVRAGLRGEDYWRLVGDVWMESENIFQHDKLWRTTWAADTPGREGVMTEDELKAYAALGDETVVWRGTGHRAAIRGLSWTTSKEKASWFARRFGLPAWLVTGQVRRTDVLAIFFGRKEDELVCRKVTIASIDELQ